MGDQPADAVNIFRLESESFQYRACFPRPQFLLYLSIIPAELHFAPVNPDIMDISGRFQNEKLFLRNPLFPPNLFGKSMNFQKMMNPTGIPFIISNHFPAQLIKQFHGILQKLYFLYYKAFPAIWDIKNKPAKQKRPELPHLHQTTISTQKRDPERPLFHFKIIL